MGSREKDSCPAEIPRPEVVVMLMPRGDDGHVDLNEWARALMQPIKARCILPLF